MLLLRIVSACIFLCDCKINNIIHAKIIRVIMMSFSITVNYAILFITTMMHRQQLYHALRMLMGEKFGRKSFRQLCSILTGSVILCT